MTASDYIPWTVWITKVFFEQGYIVDNIFYQYNVSVIKMEKYGFKPCEDKSRRIIIRYFFTKDILHRGISMLGNVELRI